MPHDSDPPDDTHATPFERFAREVLVRLERMENKLETRAEAHGDLKEEVAALRVEQQKHAATLAGHRTVIAILAAIGTALLAAVIGLLLRTTGR